MPLQAREEVVVNRLYEQLLAIPAAQLLGTQLKCIIKYSMILTRNERVTVNSFLRQQKLALQTYLLNKLKVRTKRFDRLKLKAASKFNAISSKLSIARTPIGVFNVAGELLGDSNCQPALESIIGFLTQKQVNIPEFDNAFSTVNSAVDSAYYEFKQLERAADVNGYIRRAITGTINTINAYLSVINAVDAALSVTE